VQDETMGDEVKITVIATGFKQQEMPQRRERMLAESTLPTMRYDVPIQPRVVTSRPSPRFASEPEQEPVGLSFGEGKEKPVTAGPGSPAELVPVPASVFDDDFFRASTSRAELISEVEGSHFTGTARVQHEDVRHKVEEISPVEASVRLPSPGGAGLAVDQAVPDELDIPAFLRRGN
jgi:cell division protein FtsZ